MKQINLSALRELIRQSKQPLEALSAQAVGGYIKVYTHWTAGQYHQFFSDYHLVVDSGGELYTTVDDLSIHLNHTYMRNTGAVAVAALCAYDATSCDNLGPAPPTSEQVETIAQIIAILSQELDLAVDLPHFMTHAEAADNMDGENPGYAPNGYPEGKYGPANSVERWDFWVVKVGDSPGSGGGILRGKAKWYLANGIGV